MGAKRTLPFMNKTELTGRTSGTCLHFVSTGAIETRNWNAQLAIVHGQLAAMMDDMVEHHAAKTSYPRHGKNRLPTGQQRPVLHHVRVAGLGNRRARCRHTLIEFRKDLLAVLEFWRLVAGPADGSIVKLLCGQSHRGPVGQRGQVQTIPANCAAL